uniref:t-SNARE coiled-coil homology domain-containing protein n=1 Tax=Fagus sylvatica TaxID=28930 RepID=A0A2N9H050_FAGSY
MLGTKLEAHYFNRSVHFFWWPNGLSIMILRILQALLFLLALVLRAANTPPECDSGEELITPRQQIRPRLIKSPPDPTLDVPVAGTLDQHPSRNDVLNTSMREKDQKRRIDRYQDAVVQLKKLAVEINKEVDSQNRMLDRMGNDMDSSRGVLSGTMDQDHAELRRLGGTRGENLPAAGLEVVGDGAVACESDLVGGGVHRPELEHRYVDGTSGDLDGTVHAGQFGGVGIVCGVGVGVGFGFGYGLGLVWGAFEPG